MESVLQCPICGVTDLRPLTRVEGWTINECRPCALGILSPRPDEVELSQLYHESYFSTHAIGYAKTDEERAQAIHWQEKRAACVRPHSSGQKLLDVGCASGYFLAAARRYGFDVEGVERSLWAAEEAKKQFDVPVTVGDVDDLKGRESWFDVVTMWHSLEHTKDPVSTLRSVSRLLRDGGILVVELPNYQSVDAKGYGAEWTGWSVPYHFWHFTPSALTQLLRQLGFEIKVIEIHPSEYVNQRLKAVPLLGRFSARVARWYTGRDFMTVAIKNGS